MGMSSQRAENATTAVSVQPKILTNALHASPTSLARLPYAVGRRLGRGGAWLIRHAVAGTILTSVPWLGGAAVSVAQGRSGLAVARVLSGLSFVAWMPYNQMLRRRQETERPTT